MICHCTLIKTFHRMRELRETVFLAKATWAAARRLQRVSLRTISAGWMPVCKERNKGEGSPPPSDYAPQNSVLM